MVWNYDLDKLIKMDGIYKAYHMNKKSWVTITLDDKLSDKDLFNMIDNSYIFVFKRAILTNIVISSKMIL